ncbi:MAG: DUF4175 family protein, partial [Pseudomonadota bacterium]
MTHDIPGKTRRALFWTRAGMVAERLTLAFWPLWSVLFAVLGAILIGVPELLPLEALWAFIVGSLGFGVWTLWRGARSFAWPSRDAALDRLDATLPGRP